MFKKWSLLFLFVTGFAYSQILNSTLPYAQSESDAKMVFLAGSSYYNWRQELIQKMGEKQFIFVNPTLDPKEADKYPLKRIRWEQKYIEEADAYVVWIPKGSNTNIRTLSLTTLFELGRFVENKSKPLIIGIEQGYVLREELMTQIRQLRKDAIFADSLEALSKEAIRAIKK